MEPVQCGESMRDACAHSRGGCCAPALTPPALCCACCRIATVVCPLAMCTAAAATLSPTLTASARAPRRPSPRAVSLATRRSARPTRGRPELIRTALRLVTRIAVHDKRSTAPERASAHFSLSVVVSPQECGGGTEVRTVQCRECNKVGTVCSFVDDSLCSGAGTKPDTSQACATQACVTYSWGQPSEWTQCSQSCALNGVTGNQTRTITW